MSEIIYPQIPYDEKKSVKLKYADVEKIKHLYHVEKWNMSELAEKFNVVPNTIRYHLDQEYREREKQQVSKRSHNRWLIDEEYRYSLRKRGSEWKKQQMKDSKSYRKWKNERDSKRQNHKYQKQKIKKKIKYGMRWFDA